MSKRNKSRRPAGRRLSAAESQPLRRPPGSYGDPSCRVVYVACEGSKTEADYIELLNRAYGKRPGRESFRLHLCSPAHRNGLRPAQVVEFVLASSEPEDEKWALFDRDADDNRDTEIPQAMHRAAEEGVQVALSHPSFEIWLLLHFQLWNSQENGRSGKVVDRLRQHKDAAAFKDYDKASGDRGKGLGGQRGQALLGREAAAIRNARKLVDFCPHGQCTAKQADLTAIKPDESKSYVTWTSRTGHAPQCDPLRRDPSSDVWRLLASLGIGTADD